MPKLHACESYSFVVAIVGPKGFGPPSNPVSTSTKFAAGAPPKNLQVMNDNVFYLGLKFSKFSFISQIPFWHCYIQMRAKQTARLPSYDVK